MSLLDEENRTIAETLAVCFGKIAKYDYDQAWPSLPTQLVDIVRQAAAAGPDPRARLVLHRALLTLKHVVKSLSANRMPKGRQLLEKLAPLVLPAVREIYEATLSAWTARTQEAYADIESDLDLCRLAFKVVKLLLLHGWRKIAPNEMPCVRSRERTLTQADMLPVDVRAVHTPAAASTSRHQPARARQAGHQTRSVACQATPCAPRDEWCQFRCHTARGRLRDHVDSVGSRSHGCRQRRTSHQ